MSSENTNRSDPVWKYCEIVIPGNTTKLRSKFCDEVKNGGASGIKQGDNRG